MGFADQIRPAESATTSQGPPVIKSSEQFCALLQKRIGTAKICLQTREGSRMSQLPNLAVIDDDIADGQSQSLTCMLQKHDLVAKKRLLLAYMLAKSFWQYYASDWTGVQWTKAVQFFHECRDEDDDDGSRDDDGTRILDESPYLALPPLAGQTNASLLMAEYLQTESVVHRYPRLLALGTLLLEIGRKSRPENATGAAASRCGERESETLEERVNTDLNKIRRALKRGIWPTLDLQEEVRQTCRAILENCSNPCLFEAELTTATTLEGEIEGHTIEERRAIIYRRVVYPLKQLLEKLSWVDWQGNIQQDDAKRSRGGASHETKASFLKTAERAGESSRQKSHDWLLQIQTSEVTRILFDGFKVQPSLPRIRIAVLDTGYDPNSTFFVNRTRRRRIQKWKDMTTADTRAARDEHGHGTHVLSLLMKVIPAADVYVARVARNTDELADSTSNVARVCHINTHTVSLETSSSTSLDLG